MTIQSYYERTEQHEPSFGENRDTFDFDIQHHFELSSRQQAIWGLGYRLSSDRLDNGPNAAYRGRERDLQRFSGFLQDEITLILSR